ncbi:hypothetical protein SEA_GALACTICA_14 [Streptomyces phage Galactica]|nr:hypothetical protein SEA_GALACTICA_14 [Streptomyces phage Galactica]
MAQMYRMTWQGRRLWTGRGRARAARGLQLALEHVLAESNKLVPLEEGTLQRSGTISIDPANLVGTVSYDTPYAVRQHEEMSWRHAPGRQAKYLETAVNTSRQECARIMQAELRRWLS